ncbi:hypothetical protein ASPZODRAFT_105615 [Penicilliopsis zonata CBS 506.65]|uniref:Uncharacterized protein n=1 Tax=Penicilliopsis zonata CBS 506.65 TaxID=1073090 RepID=A0A1L9S4W6_9EURO|nr:hypothetical protein ASPZODRAFT_105615 [Penicilliopsis zonata CBS 506.65]OJJ42195.1 hypothetical protein ASPZODRAFT_105615 [Penicilliopsis zonata CBS 506.65]
MTEVIKTVDVSILDSPVSSANDLHSFNPKFGPVPVATETLGLFYRNAINETQAAHHKLPRFAILAFKFKSDDGAGRFDMDFGLHATDETTVEQRVTCFVNGINSISAQDKFEGLNLEIRVTFQIEADK